MASVSHKLHFGFVEAAAEGLLDILVNAAFVGFSPKYPGGRSLALSTKNCDKTLIRKRAECSEHPFNRWMIDEEKTTA